MLHPDAAATVAALFLAHVLADYVLQTASMVRTKRGVGFAIHVSIVFATAALCLGQVSAPVLVLTAAHLMIDAIKTMALPERLWSYLLDQALHIASILAVAAWAPGAWQAGLWAPVAPDGLPWAMAALAGLVFATRAGQFAVAMFLAETGAASARGRDGILAGTAERGIVYLGVISGVIWLALAATGVAAAIRAFGAIRRPEGAAGPGLRDAAANLIWAGATGVLTLGLLAALSTAGT